MRDYVQITPRVSGGSEPVTSGIKKQQDSAYNQGFEKILQQKLNEKNVKISQHAQMRMNMRNIHLSDEQMAKLTNAVDKAEQKGVKESLILMNDLAFIVSVKNRTVITAVDGSSIKGNVFTNIDGAVIL